MDQQEPIIAFLRARYDEAATAAQQTLDRNAEARARRMSSTLWDEQDAEASQTLRDVKSKRRLLDEMVPVVNELEDLTGDEGRAARRPARFPGGNPSSHLDEFREATLYFLLILAEPFSDHEDYAATVGTVTT